MPSQKNIYFWITIQAYLRMHFYLCFCYTFIFLIGSHEPVYDVHGGKFHFYFPYYDGLLFFKTNL